MYATSSAKHAHNRLGESMPKYLIYKKTFMMDDGTRAPFILDRHYLINQERSTEDEIWVRNDEGIAHCIYMYDRNGWIGTDYFDIEYD